MASRRQQARTEAGTPPRNGKGNRRRQGSGDPHASLNSRRVAPPPERASHADYRHEPYRCPTLRIRPPAGSHNHPPDPRVAHADGNHPGQSGQRLKAPSRAGSQSTTAHPQNTRRHSAVRRTPQPGHRNDSHGGPAKRHQLSSIKARPAHRAGHVNPFSLRRPGGRGGSATGRGPGRSRGTCTAGPANRPRTGVSVTARCETQPPLTPPRRAASPLDRQKPGYAGAHLVTRSASTPRDTTSPATTLADESTTSSAPLGEGGGPPWRCQTWHASF